MGRMMTPWRSMASKTVLASVGTSMRKKLAWVGTIVQAQSFDFPVEKSQAFGRPYSWVSAQEVLVVERGQRSDLGQGPGIKRLPHPVQVIRHGGVHHPVADAQSGQSMSLGKGPGNDHIRAGR